MENQDLEKRIIDLENQVKRLTLLVDRIYSYEHLGIRKPSFENDEVLAGANPIDVDAKLQELIRNRDVIGAAKRYVDLTGIGLLDAKAAVQKLIN
jgi:ribosomal protein L7/L12